MKAQRILHLRIEIFGDELSDRDANAKPLRICYFLKPLPHNDPQLFDEVESISLLFKN